MATAGAGCVRAAAALTLAALGAMGMSAMSACAPPLPVPLDTAASLGRISSRSLDDPAVVAALETQGFAARDSGRRPSWNLDALTVAAWTLRSEMAVAAARRSAAASDLAVAQQFPNPILSLTPELVTNAATGTSPWTAAVLLTWLIRSPGSRAAAIDQAVAAGQGAAWDALAATWEIRSQVRTALLDLVLARSAAALAGEELALRRSALAIAETRVRVGAWGQPELDRARAEQLAAETQHASAAAGADAALLRVATATGLASQAALPAALALPDLDGLPQVLAAQRVPDRDAVVLNRLDVARALAEYDRADAAWRAQVARRFPDLSAGPGYTYDRRDHKIVVAVSGEVPLLHSNDAAQAAAEARRTEAAAAVEVAQAAALAQFSRAGATLSAAAHGLAGAERVVAARRSATAAERRRVAAGAGERNDVVARELECVAARRLEMDALRTGVDALTQLEASVQRPLWPQSLLDVRADARADGAAVSGVDDTLAGSKGVVQDLLVSERLRGAPSASAKESLP